MRNHAALIVALLAVVLALTGVADAALKVVSKPRPNAVLKLDRKGRFPAAAIPKVASAKNADRVGKKSATDLTMTCDPQTVDLGTWCLQSAPFPLPNEDIGKNDYFYASAACIEAGGFLPTAAQLIGAASRVKLASTIDDAPVSSSPDVDATDGLKDRREMSATLITTQAGSSAAGSEGVTEGSRGDPKGRTGPGPAPRQPGPAVAAVRHRLRQPRQGRLRGLQAGLRDRDLPLRLQQGPGSRSLRRGLKRQNQLVRRGAVTAAPFGSVSAPSAHGPGFPPRSCPRLTVKVRATERVGDRFGSAGINRYGEGDERSLHRRSSDPRWPRVMRSRL